MPFTVPTVDISRWLSEGSAEDRAAVAAEFDEACRTVGFIQILGHGIPPATIDAFASAMDGFFALDLETKKSYVAPTGHNRGYTSPKAETLNLSLGVEPVTRMNDFFEVALGLETGFFDTFTDHSIDVLRMKNYSLPPGTVDLDGDPIGMSEHTDFGIVTVL
jgi:isopenicillin N synthase-like dioxygenase